jgi:hypothetical protein
MIKQWILHIEWHWGYWPRISITPKIKHGQIGSDGGQTGHFVYCKECSGKGTLFVPDEDPRLRIRPEPSMYDVLSQPVREDDDQMPPEPFSPTVP